MLIDRTKKPSEDGTIKFNLPKINKFSLSNGLNILFVEKNDLPIVQFNFIIDAGSKLDPAGKKGLATLTSMLIDEGAGEFDALSLDSELEKLGSIFSTGVDHDTFNISLLTLKENLDRSLYLFKLILTEPNFEEPDFERERKKLVTKILQLKDEPSFIARSVFEKITFSNSSYSFPGIGLQDDLITLSKNDIVNFYKKNITVTNSTLIVVGNITKDQLRDKLEKYFGGWTSKGENRFDMKGISRNKSKIFVVNKTGAAQSEIRIGHISKGRNAPDFLAKSVMNIILGGQFTSRINLNLREKNGFTYGANSSFLYNKMMGYFVVSTAVESKNTIASISEILFELKNIRKNIKTEELEFAKSYIIKGYPALFETYLQIANNLAMLIIYNLPENYFNNYIDNINKITLEKIIQAAINNIFPDSVNILIVGDRDVILPKIKELDEFEIVELNLNGEQIK